SGSYTWTLTTPVTGFSLSTSGLLTGTPTSATSLSFQVKATDSANSNNFGTATLTLTVAQLAITTNSLLNPMVGESYSQRLQYTETNAILPLTWSVSFGALPAGFSLDPSTGAITGTATAAEIGTSSFTVQLADSSTPAQTATQPLTLTIT